jgi:hypothetical protein
VTLTDGDVIEITGAKIVVTDSGALMLLDDVRAAHALRILAAGLWTDCEEVRSKRSER